MVQKALLLSAAVVLASAFAQAGQIHVGQISGASNLGLTAGTLNTGSATSGTGSAITSSHVVLSPYDNTLFESATENGTPVATTPGYPTGTVMDGNTAYFLIGGSGNTTTNTWYSNSVANTDTIFIPINTANVTTVSTMLNDMAGSNTDVTFFLNSSDTLTGATQVTVDLVDGQEIRSAILCTANCPAGVHTSLTGGTPNYFVNGSNTASGTIGVTAGSVTFPIGTAWNPAYNGTGAGLTFAGSSGTLTLDDQAFNIASLLPLYGSTLVQVEISQASGLTGDGHFDLQAVTLETVPEPSSLALGVLGLALVGLAIARRSKRAVTV